PSLLSQHTAPTHIPTLSLHDALPISHWPPRTQWKRWKSVVGRPRQAAPRSGNCPVRLTATRPSARRRSCGDGRQHEWILPRGPPDRKSTRLNSSHVKISYAVFCLKKK